MATSPMPLRLRVEATALAGVLRVEVANTGRWAGGAPGTGLGVANVRERLALAYPGRHEWSVAEADGWVRVRLAIAGAR